MPNIVFVHRGGFNMASYRTRCHTPGGELEKYGHTVSFNGGDAHVCIFTKPYREDLAVAEKAKKNGCVIVTDIGDDHFNHVELGPVYAKMIEIADFVVAPTRVMQVRMSEFTDKDITVIPDPYEMELQEPHAEGEKLIWFGHKANLESVRRYMKLPNLTVVTGPEAGEGCIEWDFETQFEEMKKANISILPTTPGNEHRSPHRLCDSLRMGLFPICDPHPAYKEFKDVAWTGGMDTGLRWARHFQDELNDIVLEGQAYVEKHFSPEEVGRQWNDFVESI
ncbi:MAG: hypothetical protein CL963_00045 [Euryarchaeota archaeon]|jgi:hypothetical protein|nr:hypothetical protein [Euryarchaeota archaeon]|tara:strand:- start:5803 stop:6639 length:837 start_codon:yes stop_codon:yes gene_type:complete